MSNPAVGSSRSSRPTAFAWEQRRPTIVQWRDEGKTIPQIKELLEQDGFFATLRMFQSHLSNWNLDKKNKEHEIAAVARELTKRATAGKRSYITVRDREIDEAVVERYCKRRRISRSQLLALAPTMTPPAVRCHTPPPVEIVAPDVHRIPERFLAHLYAYGQKFCGAPSSPTAGLKESCLRQWLKWGDSWYVASVLDYASEFYIRGQFSKAMGCLSTAMDRLPLALPEDSPILMLGLLDHVLVQQQLGLPEVAALTIKHFGNLAALQDRTQHMLLMELCTRWLETFREQGILPLALYTMARSAMEVYADSCEKSFLGISPHISPATFFYTPYDRTSDTMTLRNSIWGWNPRKYEQMVKPRVFPNSSDRVDLVPCSGCDP